MSVRLIGTAVASPGWPRWQARFESMSRNEETFSRAVLRPDNEAAEFSIIVRSDLKGTGLGYRLMEEILAHARTRGLRRVFCDVRLDNTAMLAMTGEFGFSRQMSQEAGIATVTIDL